ncbi:MAG: T9SS type A sorting domain-containing protein, partial [Paludibacteraceae bacterium]
TGVLTYAPAIPSNVESQVMESQVYPALSNGNVFVKAQNVKSIDVVAISGQVVKQASPTGVLTTVNLTSLTDGVYIVRVKLNDNSVKSQRILLQK